MGEIRGIEDRVGQRGAAEVRAGERRTLQLRALQIAPFRFAPGPTR